LLDAAPVAARPLSTPLATWPVYLAVTRETALADIASFIRHFDEMMAP
jgi:hypothetical protein